MAAVFSGSSIAPILLFRVQGAADNSFYTVGIILSCLADDPGPEVIHKGDNAPETVSQSLEQVRIREEEHER